MCGTPDFNALSMCLTRITALSVAGGAAYAIYKFKNIFPRLLDLKIYDKCPEGAVLYKNFKKLENLK